MKFSNRDLLLVTVIVALAAGWWVDRSKLAKEMLEVRRAMELERAQSTIAAAEREITKTARLEGARATFEDSLKAFQENRGGPP